MNIDTFVKGVERRLDICSQCKHPMGDGVVLVGHYLATPVDGSSPISMMSCKKCPQCGYSRVKRKE